MHDGRNLIKEIRNQQAVRKERQAKLDWVTQELKSSTAEALSRSRNTLWRSEKRPVKKSH